MADTYLGSVRTEVIAAGAGPDRPWVALADNIFHPQGGGQPSDKGTVNGIPVFPRRGDEGSEVVLDFSESEPGLHEGDAVTANIDMEARKQHAALHTAGHLIDAVMRQLGYRHVANNHYPGQARVEYLADSEVDKDWLAGVLSHRTAEAIAAGLRVTASSQDSIRLITIESMGSDPCGGTHVPDLLALQDLRIRSVKIKGNRLRVGYDAAHAPMSAASKVVNG
jgi:Ser-tRNA(Ala) deacylase AlaX